MTKNNESVAGNLNEELQELEMFLQKDEGIIVAATATAGCNSFLTIYCC